MAGRPPPPRLLRTSRPRVGLFVRSAKTNSFLVFLVTVLDVKTKPPTHANAESPTQYHTVQSIG